MTHAAYPVLADLKTFLSISTSGDDGPLAVAIEAAVGFVREYTDREFVVPGADSNYSFPVRAPYVGGKRRILRTVDIDLYSVTSVTDSYGEVYPSTDWQLYPLNTIPAWGVELLNGRVFPLSWDGNPIVLTAKAAYSATVPETIWFAMLSIAQHLYNGMLQGSHGAMAMATRSGVVLTASDIDPLILRTLSNFKRARL